MRALLDAVHFESVYVLSENMTSNSRSITIPQEEWEKYKAEITSLFQDITYAQIIDHLSTKYNFHPRYVLLKFFVSTDMIMEV